MIRNYYKLALRHITRSRFYAFLNIFGLSTGIAFTLLIAAYCWNEWRVNRQLKDADRQYILTSTWKDPNMGYPLATLGPLAKSLKDNYPNLVAGYYRFDGIYAIISNGEKHFRENLAIGDSTLLSLYGFSLLQGDPHTALAAPFSVVITGDMAVKYFGRTDVVGKNLTIEDFSGGKKDFRITAVLQLPERNSVTRLNENNENKFFVPTANLSFFNRGMEWQNRGIASYIELQKGVGPDALDAPIGQLLKANTDPSVSSNLKVSAVPLQSYYLTGNVKTLSGDGGDVLKMLYTLSFIACFVLLMAIVNFINLAVSRSTSRMKEIGIRKVLGGLRRQLILQFLTESVLLALLATGLALGLYKLFAPVLSGMLDNEIPGFSKLPVMAWITLPVFALVVGCLAGLYPAFVLSSHSSVDSLKGKGGSKENVLLRKGLVAFQFATATIVFVGAIIVSQQIRLFFSNRLGYNKDWIVFAQLPRDWTAAGVGKMVSIRDAFSRTAGVQQATLSFEIPDGGNGGSNSAWREGGDSSRAVVSQMLSTDEHYADTYQIPMAAGSFFNRQDEGGSQDIFRVVINETECRALGWTSPEQAIGRRIRLQNSPKIWLTVSGVTKNFHFGSMSSPIDPNIFAHVSFFNSYRYLSFKLRPGNIGTNISALQREWATLLPGEPFEYRFMDEALATMYKDELHLKKAASTATVLALIIVLLGIMGMLSLSIQKRTKEIAIRKVVGAAVPAIIRLFLLEFLPLLLLAGLIATPVAWWIMQHWLNDYATRISITPWPFILAILSLGVVMIVLIISQTMRAALANPIRSLKAE